MKLRAGSTAFTPKLTTTRKVQFLGFACAYAASNNATPVARAISEKTNLGRRIRVTRFLAATLVPPGCPFKFSR